LSSESCQQLIGRLKAAGGQAEMLDPAERGIKGHSHMIMQDKNHLQIADLILKWSDERVTRRPAGARGLRGRDVRPRGCDPEQRGRDAAFAAVATELPNSITEADVAKGILFRPTRQEA
jgi:hypothetical protein